MRYGHHHYHPASLTLVRSYRSRSITESDQSETGKRALVIVQTCYEDKPSDIDPLQREAHKMAEAGEY
jgi:hypothetical protein